MALDPYAELHEYVVGNEEDGSFKIDLLEPNDTPMVTAIRDIPKGSFIMASHLASSIIIGDQVLANLRKKRRKLTETSRSLPISLSLLTIMATIPVDLDWTRIMWRLVRCS
jgi:hypothetical protein